MKEKQTDKDDVVITDELVEEALDLAARDAIEAHRRGGVPLVVWRDGKIARVTADEALAARDAFDRSQRRARKRRR